MTTQATVFDPLFKLKRIQAKAPEASITAEPVKNSSDMLGVVDDLVDFFEDYSRTNDYAPLEHASEITKILVASKGFFPLMWKYAVAYYSGADLPETKTSTKIKFVYSGVILSLMLALIVLNLTLPLVASTLYLVIAGITLSWSMYKLVKTLVNNSKLVTEKELIDEKLLEKQEALTPIQLEAQKLEILYNQRKKGFYSTTDLAELDEIYTEITKLYDKYEHGPYEKTKKSMQLLEIQKQAIEQKLAFKTTLKIMDRSISLSLGAASVFALVLSLYFPPIGAAIITAVLITTAAYTGLRFIIPSLYYAAKWLIGSNKQEVVTLATQSHPEDTCKIHESTADVMALTRRHDSKVSMAPTCPQCKSTAEPPKPKKGILENKEAKEDEGEGEHEHNSYIP
ncbi:MAG: hypothetical protein H0U75_01960 [Legionella sp.]|nr:hypothetical protein [Legionella sp.]